MSKVDLLDQSGPVVFQGVNNGDSAIPEFLKDLDLRFDGISLNKEEFTLSFRVRGAVPKEYYDFLDNRLFSLDVDDLYNAIYDSIVRLIWPKE